MMEDCFDFHHYSFRKGSINHYLQVMDFQKSVYRGRWIQRAVRDWVKVISKIAKSGQSADQIKEEFEKYKETDEYKKWQKDYDNRDDDDDVRNDQDPQGWDLYIRAASEHYQVIVNFAMKVGPANPENAELQAKCLKVFMSCDKPDYALQMAENMLKHSPQHPKAIRTIAAFEGYMKGQKFERSLDEFNGLLKNWQKSKSDNMEAIHELLKDDPKQGKKAIAALEKDADNFKKVYLAEKTHRRLAKTDEKVAKEY